MNTQSISSIFEESRQSAWTDEQLATKAVELAELVLNASNAEITRGEKTQAEQLARMMHDPAGKALTLQLADRVFRPATRKQSAELFRHLVDEYKVPSYLSWMDRVAMKTGAIASAYFPTIVMGGVTWQLRRESSNVILPSEDAKLHPHVVERKQEGIRLNFNQLGEAILGETEAVNRLEMIVKRLQNDDCNYISVKISSICSQLHMITVDETVEMIQERLRVLYRTAMENPVTLPNGNKRAKFVSLDMEEYRDLHITMEAFQSTLNEPEFHELEAGIVLQAYLPDSWVEQQKLTAWAKARVEAGGGRIKLRLVKGANLAMEKVDASLHDWSLAPYESKEQVDANFKRMLHYGADPANAKYVQIGLASHNLFDLCYTMLLREKNGVVEQVELEMLEGMANHQARVVGKLTGDLLLYAPVVKKEDFPSAISYLVRRLDENTSEENFLHDLFGMTPGSKEWDKQRDKFLQACKEIHTTKFGPNRKQDRTNETHENNAPAAFHNEADTDWALPVNAAWARDWVAKESAKDVGEIPLVVEGQEIKTSVFGVGRDPAKGNEKAYSFSCLDFETAERAIGSACVAGKEWSNRPIEERAELMYRTANELAKMRGELIGAMVRDAGKVPSEADVEISEAIDFCRYYAEGLTRPGMQDGVELTPLGVICVIPPWNFPCAIPCGGVAAALMAGNAVLFKPSSMTIYTAWVVAQAFWRAGVPRDVLQFVSSLPNEIGKKLIEDERVDGIIFTGSYETGRMFQSWRPDMKIFAETSGKDALVITATADPDLAVKDLVKSAFGHSGQKCSAASLAIVEAPLYDSPSFMRQLRDAAASLKVGSSWDINSIVTPIIKEASGALLRGLTTLEEGEEWLLKPEKAEGNSCLWSPGIRIGVKPGSWYHRNECFGPVLGVIRANNLEHAIQIQNDSDFGLTGGIHALDEREIELWKQKVQIGNAYINRAITGAIVRRQPFGGWKNSCFGPGSKAGGPNYLMLLESWRETALPSQQVSTLAPAVATLTDMLVVACPAVADRIRAGAGSQTKWWAQEFSIGHDPSQVYGEANVFRYVPEKKTVLRVTPEMCDSDVALVILATTTTGTKLELSLESPLEWLNQVPGITATVEDISSLQGRMEALKGSGVNFIRLIDCDTDTHRAAIAASVTILDRPIMANGRLELLNYLREQAIAETLHRYGNIIPKADQL